MAKLLLVHFQTHLYTNWFELPFFKVKLITNQLLAENQADEKALEEQRAAIFESYQKILKESSLNATIPTDVTLQTRSKRDVVTSAEKLISFSDHEAVTSTIYMWF